REAEIVLPRQRDHLLANGAHFLARLFDIAANAGPDLDHRLVHLRLHALGQQRPALFHDLLLDMRAQVARFRIDGLIFLFDADAEARSAHAAPFREAAARNFDQWYGSCTAFCSLARSIAISATLSTIQRKFSGPTDSSPASGAGFMKSIAYGTPSSTANSTVLRS